MPPISSSSSSRRPRSNAPVLSDREERARPVYVLRAKRVAKLVKDYLSRSIRYSGRGSTPILPKETRALVHYFLAATSVEESRRSRRAERMPESATPTAADNAAPTTSLAY